ncbi:hypothetical protein [Bradyrhizobium sp. CB2312]|uniref:hypothetical protein n=1 Tax=Bradyrhizobium sp. CB2312 TaxID=3039155 RepID=UPI0024B1F38D|nr:hypothetical protein [Bradyrhizobium sp. CB2312]WFU71333.1 hypothetical protein QA642_40080 [Bradyrhizobium sp. CB2312]
MGTEKQGDFHGKLSRLIQRLEGKRTDRRLGFLFPASGVADSYDWLDRAVELLLGGRAAKGGHGGVKIIEFSEVLSDILPLIVGMVARMAFHIQQWSTQGPRHPVALFCDEAHLIFHRIRLRAPRRMRSLPSSASPRRGGNMASGWW